MDIVIVERETPEWQFIWDYIAKHPINEGIIAPELSTNNGQTWEYMGSYRQGNKVIHSMRHRSHPRDNQRKDITFHASEKFTNEQISKVIKVK